MKDINSPSSFSQHQSENQFENSFKRSNNKNEIISNNNSTRKLYESPLRTSFQRSNNEIETIETAMTPKLTANYSTNRLTASTQSPTQFRVKQTISSPYQSKDSKTNLNSSQIKSISNLIAKELNQLNESNNSNELNDNSNHNNEDQSISSYISSSKAKLQPKIPEEIYQRTQYEYSLLPNRKSFEYQNQTQNELQSQIQLKNESQNQFQSQYQSESKYESKLEEKIQSKQITSQFLSQSINNVIKNELKSQFNETIQTHENDLNDIAPQKDSLSYTKGKSLNLLVNYSIE